MNKCECDFTRLVGIVCYVCGLPYDVDTKAQIACFSCDYVVEDWIMAWDFDYGNFPVCVDCMAEHNYYTAGV